MTSTPNRTFGTAPHGQVQRAVITDAHAAHSQGQARRQKRYAITMAFRTACFVCMIFVPGAFRWVLFAGAVFLPYVAVIFANQADVKTQPNEVEHGEPSAAPQIGGRPAEPEVISGSVVEDAEERRGA